MSDKQCPKCGEGKRNPLHVRYKCGRAQGHKGDDILQCLRNQLAQRDEADAALHKRLGFEGFDEDVTFHEAVALLLKEFGEAKRELAERDEQLAEAQQKVKAVSEALQPYMLKFDILNTRATEAIPAVISGVEAEGRREMREEAAQVAMVFQDIIGWQTGESRNKLIGDIAEKIRRLPAQGQQETCETCGGSGEIPFWNDGLGPARRPCRDCRGLDKPETCERPTIQETFRRIRDIVRDTYDGIETREQLLGLDPDCEGPDKPKTT